MKKNMDFISQPFNSLEGRITWQSPSNIALVKYWGKYGDQFPQNPSLSLTLSNCHTTTKIEYKPRKSNSKKYAFSFLFEGEQKPDFHPKIEQFLDRIALYCPYVLNHEFIISSSNSFPHSSGIASSASGMSALSLSLLSIEKEGVGLTEEQFLKKASFLARLGSGSAARSIQGPVMSWGHSPFIEGSSQEFATHINSGIHSVFSDYQDTILLIDKGQKKVSSTLGHQLMEKHPYADVRFKQAHQNISRLIEILSSGSLTDFIALVEHEALTLHALMMASNPSFILMHPATLEVINKVWEYRKETNLPLCFTLDAGANVHLLYPKSNATTIQQFIADELAMYCQNNHYINDQIGDGAKKM